MGMQLGLVMTVIGRDRPGLVDRLSGIIARHRGNWLESRMSRLGGHFAGILRIHVDSQEEGELTRELESLAAEGLKVVVHADREPAVPGTGTLLSLEIVGHDRPGIVSQISRVLARHGVNVEELCSECASAAMSGEMLFKAQAKLQIPPSCEVARLRADLEEIAADLVVDLAMEEISK